MGLRAASVRHSDATVMAPALTEANQTENFKKSSAVNGHSRNSGGCLPLVEDRSLMCKELESSSMVVTNGHNNISDALENLNTLALVSSEIVKVNNKTIAEVATTASDISLNQEMNNQGMNDPEPEQPDNNMGLHAPQKEMSPSSLLKEPKHTMADVDQLIHNVIQGTELGSGDLASNVDDFIQVLNNMEENNEQQPDGVSDQEITFPINAVNLQNFCSKLLGEVGVLSYEPTDDQMVVDQEAVAKEIITKERIFELTRTQNKLERRYDFLLRRLQKVQARNMAQHVSGEVAGLYELSHNLLNQVKERPPEDPMDEFSLKKSEQPSTSSVWLNIEISENLKGLSTISMKNLVHKLEKTKSMQSNPLYRNKTPARYFGAGSVEVTPSVLSNVCRNNCVVLPPLGTDASKELERVSGLLETEMKIVKQQVDSDATASSSGAESCDEMQNFNNPHQQYCTIAKRASWKYAQERAAVATRWTWVQSQISDLEYRIRQLNELHKQIRNLKGPVIFGNVSTTATSITNSPGSVNGYRGILPGATKPIIDPTSTMLHNGSDFVLSGSSNQISGACSRTKPFVKSVFKNRRLLQTTGLHVISKKWRPSSVRCNCVPGMPPCALCTGRSDPTFPKESRDLTTVQQQLGYLDAGFHPKISFPEDVNQSFHYDAVLKMPEWQQKTARSMTKALKLAVKNERLDKSGEIRQDRLKKPEYRKKYNKLLKASTASALSAKIKNRLARGRKPKSKTQAAFLARLNRKRPSDVALAQLQALSTSELENTSNEVDDYEYANSMVQGSSRHPSPSASPTPHPDRLSREYRRNRIDSYDIDNIVIPYSVAATTRVEKLPYKEILTPKWRVVDVDPAECPSEAITDDTTNNGVERSVSTENEEEDISDDIILIRHEKCEIDERKKFMSYIKFPLTGVRPRANRRTDSRAESSGANTPDPMSPQANVADIGEASNSPITSPPATPMSASTNPQIDDLILNHSIGSLRRRTASQSRWAREREERCITPDQYHVEVPPYDNREFPLPDEVYETMLSAMPDGLPVRSDLKSEQEFLAPILMDSESSTDSILGEEDPNDPEWMVVNRIRDKPKR